MSMIITPYDGPNLILSTAETERLMNDFSRKVAMNEAQKAAQTLSEEEKQAIDTLKRAATLLIRAESMVLGVMSKYAGHSYMKELYADLAALPRLTRTIKDIAYSDPRIEPLPE